MAGVIIAASLLLAPTGASAAQAVDDAQIAAIVATANQVEIDAGKFVRADSTNAEVRKFAELMITDHTSVNASATALATRLKVTPQDQAERQ